MTTVIESLDQFEQTLPEAPQPVGSYVTALQVGNLLYTSGALPVEKGVVKYTGHVGRFGFSLEEGQAAARLCCINLLSIIRQQLGTLQRVERIVKVTGFVNSPPAFTDHPKVVNGASDFLVEVFGDAGRHTRAAVGVSSLPLNAMVEVEMIVAVKP